MTLPLLAVFIPTFFFVSFTPGMCMTLALSLGMTLGVRRTLWMMYGELLGVGLVAAASVVGVAAFMLRYPTLFTAVRLLGGAYLIYLGVQLWLSRGKMAIDPEAIRGLNSSPGSLALQGFLTAVANPKGWAFFIALLPPFVNEQRPLLPQLSLLLTIILSLEFLCLMLYAGGGRTLTRLLQQKGKLRLINRVAGTLMLGVGLWLAVG